MSIANAIDIDVFSLLILGFIYANTNKRAEHAFIQHRLFIAMICILALLLATDALSRIVDGNHSLQAYYTNYVSNVLLFILTPVTSALWLLYADYQVFHSDTRLRKIAWLLAIYLVINTFFSISTITTGWYFFIDSDNIYHRGPLAVYHFLSCYAVLLYVSVFAYLNRRIIDSGHFLTLLIFSIPPAIGGILQGVFYGLVLLGPGMTLSILLIYNNIQDKRLNTDYLTSAYNRRLLDSYIKDKIMTSKQGRTFSAILIDLDDFKEINDSHGHITGDDALLDAVVLLKSCLRNNDFIARYGGDEFLIVLDINSMDVLVEAVERIKNTCEKFNKANSRPYALSFSIGYAIYDPASGLNAEGFLRHIDKLMYADKKRALVQ